MICNSVVTYHVNVPGHWSPPDDEQNLLKLWKASWEKYGWEAIVLTEEDAKTHPRYNFFNHQFRAKPSEYGSEYTTACFMRWLCASHYAALRSGYAMLTDSDVINYGLEPMEVIPGQMRILCDEPPGSVFMGTVFGSAQHFLDMAELFAAWTPDELDWNHHAQCYHQDDLSMLVRMFETKTRPKPDWLVKVPGTALWDYSSCRSSKLVHYGYALYAATKRPKYQVIPGLRSI